MSENRKEIVVFLIMGLFIIGAMAGVLSYGNGVSRENKQKEIQKINECIEKSSDLNWCMDNFLQ